MPLTGAPQGKQAFNYVWDVDLLIWVKQTAASSGSGTVVEQGAAGTDPWLVAIDGTVSVSGPLTDTQLRAADVKITLDGESVPVTGTFFQVTQPVSAAALPLPALAATSTKQSDGTQKTQLVDGAGNVIGATSNALDINIKSGNPSSISVSAVTPGTTATSLGKAEDAGHLSGDVGVFALGVRNDSPNATLGADADYIQFSTDKVGGIRIAPPETDFAVLGSKHVKKYYTNAGAVTDGIIWSPAAGARWYITSIFLNVSAAATVTLEDDKTGGDEAVWKAELAANSGWATTFPVPWFSGEDAADLMVTTTAGNVYITVVGYEI